jgi:hypothetical protein
MYGTQQNRHLRRITAAIQVGRLSTHTDKNEKSESCLRKHDSLHRTIGDTGAVGTISIKRAHQPELPS